MVASDEGFAHLIDDRMIGSCIGIDEDSGFHVHHIQWRRISNDAIILRKIRVDIPTHYFADRFGSGGEVHRRRHGERMIFLVVTENAKIPSGDDESSCHVEVEVVGFLLARLLVGSDPVSPAHGTWVIRLEFVPFH